MHLCIYVHPEYLSQLCFYSFFPVALQGWLLPASSLLDRHIQ